MYLGLIVPAYSFGEIPTHGQFSGQQTDFPCFVAYFSPTIIQGYGHDAIQTQLLAIPPYACAFAFGMLMAAISDRLCHRFFFALLGSFIGLGGFIMLYIVHNRTEVQYAGLFLAAIGTYTAMPLVLGWFGMNGQFIVPC